MAEASLNGYIIISREQGPRPWDLTLGNIELPGDVKPAPSALTMLFGYRDTLAEMSRRRTAAEAAGLHLVAVTISVDIGPRGGRVTLAELPEHRYLNFTRITGDIENLILQKWKNYLGVVAADGSTEGVLMGRTNQFVVDRPELITRLHAEPEFEHLDIIAYPVRSERGFLQVGTLFRSRNITRIECLDDPTAKIHLPADLPE